MRAIMSNKVFFARLDLYNMALGPWCVTINWVTVFLSISSGFRRVDIHISRQQIHYFTPGLS